MKNEGKTSNKKTKIVLIVAAAVLVLLGAFLFWFFNRKFVVTFNVSDSEKYTIKVKYNKTISKEDIKTEKELGENFIGWYEVISAGDEEELAKDSFDFSTKIKEEKSLKAVYKAEKEIIKITFDTKGGSKVSSITIDKGDKLTLPASPTKKGYTFLSWTLKSGKNVKNKTVFNEDTTIYAKWEKVEEPITITFDTKGGSKVDSKTITKGSALSLPTNPTRSGYTFEGWTLANGKSVANNTKFSENTTIYANWKKVEEPKKEEKVTITFDTKGGSKVDSKTITKGSALSLPTNPTKSGYSFEGWTLANGKSVANNTKFNEDTTIYAEWKKLEEKISLRLSRKNIHRNGYNTSKAIATVENASGEVTYEINNNICVSIDARTGELTATRVPDGGGAKIRSWINNCQNNSKEVTVTAKLPSGKSASATLIVEKDLKLEASFYSAREKQPVESDGENFYVNNDKEFSVSANQTVTWTVKPEDSCTTTGANNVKSNDYNGTILAKCNGTDAYKRTYVTATTDANQKLSVWYNQTVN